MPIFVERWQALLQKTSLVTLILLIFSLLPAPSPVAHAEPLPAAESRTKYTMVVNLDYEKASLTARESVVYTNNTPLDLNSVVFNVTPAQFKAFTLNSASVDGRKVTPAMEGVVMEVPLPQTLTSGKAITVELDFRVDVPKRGGRFGVGEGIIALGNWFPVVAVYGNARLASNERPSGWSRHKYVEVGDAFFTEAADYAVTVNTSSPVVIAHTGILVGKDTNRWQMQARGARDFAMAISNRYQTQSRSVDGVVITAYYLPGHAAVGPQYLEAASQALQRLNRLVAPYPNPTLHLAEVYAQSSIAMGQEYPNLIFMSSTANDLGGGIDSYLAYVIMHEVAHQWFYGMVGNDQIYQPWLDEALATWFGYHVLRMAAPELFPSVWQNRVVDLLAEGIRRYSDLPVNRSIYDFPEETHYYNIVYRKGALFVEELYKAMGDARFFAAMKDYGATFRERVATPIAFFDLFQSHTSEDLSPLIAKYFSYERYRAGAAPNATVEFPPGPIWSGIAKPQIRSNYPVDAVLAIVEDRIVWSGSDPTQVAVDTAKLRDGEEYLLTIKLMSSKQAIERVQRFGVYNQPKVEPTQIPAVFRQDPSPTLLSDSVALGAVLVGALGLVLGLVYAVRRAR